MQEIEIGDLPDFMKDFAIEDPATTVDKKEKEIKSKEDKEVVKEPTLEDLKKELEDQDNPEDKEEAEDKPKDKETKEEPKEETSFKSFMEIMAEEGVLDLEEGEEILGSAEDLVTKFTNTVDSRVNEAINDYKEAIPELGKQFLAYLENGGDPRKFIEAAAAPLDFTDLDLTDESNQKRVVREWLKAQGDSKEEIDEQIQDFEDGLVLEKQAKLAVKKLEKLEGKRTEQLAKEQEVAVATQRKELETYVKNVQEVITSSKEIAGLPVTDKEKKEFEQYLFKKDKNGVTDYQKEIAENPHKTQVELAFLKFKKYDFSKVAKKAESTAASKIREKILSKTETTIKGQSAETNSNVDLGAFQKAFGKLRK